MFRWFILPKPTIATNGIYLFSIKLTGGEPICFRNLEYIADRFDNQCLLPEGNDLGVVFMSTVRSGSPSLQAILEESASEDDLASSDGGSCII
jgi:organic radical activating enzyme